MAASCPPMTPDQFVCSICLELFTAPVATPCGHNFCKACIVTHWQVNSPCTCPMCKEVFHTQPELQVNALISQMADHFRGLKMQKTSKPHLLVAELKAQPPVGPRKSLKDSLCLKHHRPLELFCKTEELCICRTCSSTDHGGHTVVLTSKEYEVKKTLLSQSRTKIQRMIGMRSMKVQQMKKSVQAGTTEIQRETADGLLVLSALKECVDRTLAKYTEMMGEQQVSVEKHAEEHIIQLDQEISLLVQRDRELDQLFNHEDKVVFLQGFRSFEDALPTKNWSTVDVRPPSLKAATVATVTELKELLSRNIQLFFETELRKVQKYAINVTFDPETANSWLVLSTDCKQVAFSDVNQRLPELSKRFSYYAGVLGRQGFSTGRFYYEVQVAGKTKWDLGVARESVNRKGQITLDPSHGFWTISLRHGDNQTPPWSQAQPSEKTPPQKVGVFVDYEEGLLSFYNVTSAVCIHSFTGCSFTDKIYPFFNPCGKDGGRNSAPLIITPVLKPNTPKTTEQQQTGN